ncbi:MAG: two-component system histidine kinase PnpS [Candidatus Omnitrophota bacterium]
MFFGINKQIKQLVAKIEGLSPQEPGGEINIYSKGQLTRLASALNSLLKNFRSYVAELQQENTRAQAMLNSMVEGVIALDATAHIVSINPSAEDILKVTKKEVVGRLFLEVIRNNDIYEVIENVLKTGKFISRELNIVLPVQKIFRINASPIFESANISGCLLVIHDITEIRRLEVMRRDFVANVSHELKTPLTSIKGFVETLLEGALKDEKNSRHFLGIIEEHTNRLNALVNDLLDLSYIESGQRSLMKEEISIKKLVEVVLASFKSQIKKKDILIKNDLPDNLVLKADKDKLEQVLTNLIDNAIKFNKEEGFLKIYSQDSGDKIKIIVEDSGIGIPPKDVPRIFERFYRVDKARSRELGGTGLGLSIVKHIIELHAGEVGVESTEGLGSKFSFILPK